ncbi:MAG: Coenzyme F420 hydrogenase/dehydrogenase, beta subunit C-terminal domain [Desulfobaccales bacterium]
MCAVKSPDPTAKDLDFMKRQACQYCSDFSAEFGDPSFGGIGAPEGWTMVITRTLQERALLDGAADVILEKYPHKAVASQVLAKVIEWSEQKSSGLLSSTENLGKLVRIRTRGPEDIMTRPCFPGLYAGL